MRMFDTHCHLQAGEFGDNVAGVVNRAASAGVTPILCCGTCESDWSAVDLLSTRFDGILPAYGLHPLYAGARTASWLSPLTSLVKKNGVAVGEIGLDHSVEPRNDADQEEVFLTQLHLAAELNRPVSIHCRKAWGRMVEILDGQNDRPEVLVFHSFSGASDLIDRLTALGGYFSFSGTITRSGNRRGRAAALAVPEDRLLVETDAPDLTPVMRDRPGAGQGTLNEPANLRYVVAALAGIRGMTEERVASLTADNAMRIFSGNRT